MQKVQPAKNTLDMDFLNSFDKPLSKNSTPTTPIETVQQVVEKVEDAKKEVETKIESPTSIESEFETADISLEEDISSSKIIKATQIVVRTTEKERNALKSYFMKHGVSLSKGIKIAIKYLEQQEKKGLVHFSDIGLYQE